MKNAFGYELLAEGIIERSFAWTSDSGDYCEAFFIRWWNDVEFVVYTKNGDVIGY